MEYYVRTVQVNPEDPLYSYCSGICQAVNNLYNAALDVERQVFLGIGKKPEELDEKQKAVLKSIEENLDKMNETVRDETKRPRYKMPTPGRPFLNYEFLRAYMQVTENPHYLDNRMTRDTAKNVLKEVSGVCICYLKALKSYGKNPDKFTGKPELPHYLKKQGMHTASLSTNDCVLTTIEELRKSEPEIMKRASTGTPHRDAMSVEHKNRVVYFYRTEYCCDIGNMGDPIESKNKKGSKKGPVEPKDPEEAKGFEDPEKFRRVTEVKIVPCTGCFRVHVHMIPDKEKHSAAERNKIKAAEDAQWAALAERCNKTPLRACSIDLGVENLASITNNVGEPCVIIKGGFVKSLNQYFNKKMAELRSKLDKENNKNQSAAPIEKASEKMQSNGPGEMKNELGRNPIASKSKKVRKPDNTNQPIDVQIQHLCTYRENKMKDLFSKEADAIICWCKKLNFDVIVVGKNSGWKQNANMGSVNNQKFVYIPFEKFIQQLMYRAKRENIYLLLQEESYTSQASFLDNDPIPTYQEGDTTVYKFSGVRGPTVNAAGMTKPKKADGKGNPRYRGLYMAKDGTIINADLNASANIGRKALPKMFIDGQKPDFNRVIVIKNPDDTKEELLKSTEQPDNKES